MQITSFRIYDAFEQRKANCNKHLTKAEVINLLRKYEEELVELNEATARDFMERIYEETGKSLVWRSGATKLVIFTQEGVLKIPFHYTCEEIEFTCGGGPDKNDYCAREVEVFLDAEDYSIENFFAKLKEECVINGTTIYSQGKCHAYEEIFCKDFLDSCKGENWTKEEKDFLDSRVDLLVFPLPWIVACLRAYGKEATDEFLAFCCDFVSDIHCGNFGINEKGKPVVIDYGGFFDS